MHNHLQRKLFKAFLPVCLIFIPVLDAAADKIIKVTGESTLCWYPPKGHVVFGAAPTETDLEYANQLAPDGWRNAQVARQRESNPDGDISTYPLCTMEDPNFKKFVCEELVGDSAGGPLECYPVIEGGGGGGGDMIDNGDFVISSQQSIDSKYVSFIDKPDPNDPGYSLYPNRVTRLNFGNQFSNVYPERISHKPVPFYALYKEGGKVYDVSKDVDWKVAGSFSHLVRLSHEPDGHITILTAEEPDYDLEIYRSLVELHATYKRSDAATFKIAGKIFLGAVYEASAATPTSYPANLIIKVHSNRQLWVACQEESQHRSIDQYDDTYGGGPNSTIAWLNYSGVAYSDRFSSSMSEPKGRWIRAKDGSSFPASSDFTVAPLEVFTQKDVYSSQIVGGGVGNSCHHLNTSMGEMDFGSDPNTCFGLLPMRAGKGAQAQYTGYLKACNK